MSKAEWQKILDAIKALWILAMAEGDEETARLSEQAEEIHNKYKPKTEQEGGENI